MLTALWIGGGLGVLMVIVTLINETTKKANVAKTIAALPGFVAAHSYTSTDGTTGIAIDEVAQRAMLVRNDAHEIKHRVIDCNDFLAVELVQDGTSVSKTNRASQAAGMLVGGVLLGGAGLIVGGLSGSSTIKGKTTKIDLVLTVNDTNSPVHVVRFQHQAFPADGIITKKNLAVAQEWLARIKVIMHAADAKGPVRPGPIEASRLEAPQIPQVSIADELRKLADLHRDGIIDVDEFGRQKSRLLS